MRRGCRPSESDSWSHITVIIIITHPHHPKLPLSSLPSLSPSPSSPPIAQSNPSPRVEAVDTNLHSSFQSLSRCPLLSCHWPPRPLQWPCIILRKCPVWLSVPGCDVKTGTAIRRKAPRRHTHNASNPPRLHFNEVGAKDSAQSCLGD